MPSHPIWDIGTHVRFSYKMPLFHKSFKFFVFVGYFFDLLSDGDKK